MPPFSFLSSMVVPACSISSMLSHNNIELVIFPHNYTITPLIKIWYFKHLLFFFLNLFVITNKFGICDLIQYYFWS